MSAVLEKPVFLRAVLLIAVVSVLGCEKESGPKDAPQLGAIITEDGFTLQETEALKSYGIEWTSDRLLITRVNCDSIGLGEFLAKINPDKWLLGTEVLPKGNYRITFEKLPASPIYLSTQLFHVIDKSFHVKATEGNTVIAGYRLKPPPVLPQIFDSPAGNWSVSTSKDGCAFKGYSIVGLATWLESTLAIPIDYADSTNRAEYDFELKCDVFQPVTITNSLREIGFIFEDAKLVRSTILFEKN